MRPSPVVQRKTRRGPDESVAQLVVPVPVCVLIVRGVSYLMGTVVIYHARRPCSFVMGHTSPAASVGPVCYVSLYNSWPIFRKDLFHTRIAQCSVNDSQACIFASSACFCPLFRAPTNCPPFSKEFRAAFSHRSGAANPVRNGCLTSNAANLQPTAVSKFVRSSD